MGTSGVLVWGSACLSVCSKFTIGLACTAHVATVMEDLKVRRWQQAKKKQRYRRHLTAQQRLWNICDRRRLACYHLSDSLTHEWDGHRQRTVLHLSSDWQLPTCSAYIWYKILAWLAQLQVFLYNLPLYRWFCWGPWSVGFIVTQQMMLYCLHIVTYSNEGCV